MQPWTLPLLARVAPDAKILVMLVNPFEAYRKAYLQRKARVERGDKRVWMNTAAADREYGTQIARPAPLLRPRHRSSCSSSSAAGRIPRGVPRTLRFLGVREDFMPPAAPARRARPGTSASTRRCRRRTSRRMTLDAAIGRPPSDEPSGAELWPDIEQALHADLDDEIRQLVELAPSVDLSLWPEFAHLSRESLRGVAA